MVRLGIILTVLVVVLAVLFSFMPDGEEEVLQRLNNKDIYPIIKLLSYRDSLRVRVTSVGDETKSTLLLIHGSPGDWSAWENIFLNDSIRESFYILAIDRPGYGGTTVPAQTSLQVQADVVWSTLKQLQRTEKVIIVGHSYGGAVVEQLLINLPEAFDLAILVAPTLSPDLMKPKWYNKVARWKIVNSILSKDLKASNIEMMGLTKALELNEPNLSLIKTPIIYIQGKKDVLVPHETVDYLMEHKPDGVKYVIVEDMNHFTPWSDPYLITDALLGKIKD
jgi:pimeloyl-ACP methyl ester carboxylesterase